MKETYEPPFISLIIFDEDILTISGNNGDYYVKDVWEDLDE